jgi:general L-amino acid transport system permease protein
MAMSTAASADPPGIDRWARARARLFASPGASVVTVLLAALFGWAGWHLVGWGVIESVTRPDVAACRAAQHGACWGFVAEKWRLILFGRYPYEQQWRPALATSAVVAMLVASALPALWSGRGARWLAAGWVLAFAIFFMLMFGGIGGLEPVGTDRWGGLPLTVILTLIGMAASTPIGIALALARRSSLALLRSMAAAYIELVRGVPLITVLFVATFVFPLVLPAGWRRNRWRPRTGSPR